MDVKNVSGKLHLFNILLRRLQKDVEVFRGDLFLPAVKSVMELLGDLEKGVISTNHIPACVNSQLRQQRHHAGQDLRDTAAAERGVDILNDLATQPVGQQRQLLDGATADNRSIIGDTYLMRFSIS